MNKADRLKIGFISRYDLNDRAAASGSFYSMASALQQHCGEVRPLAPLSIPWRQARRVAKGLAVYLLRKNWDYERTNRVSRSYARQIAGLLAKEESDLLFAPMGSIPLANYQTKLPVVLLGDATYQAMVSNNPRFANFFKSHIKTGNQIEKKALERADLILYASDWAASSAVVHYGINTSKIRVVPFGANLDFVPTQERLRGRTKQESCTLLFLAVDWELKGGQIALETLYKLRGAGLNARLVICGCQPAHVPTDGHITVVPRLNKNNQQDRVKLDEMLLAVDFLIHPARFEAFGIVIAEANAYGIPALATTAGGIPSAIKDGENGFLLPLSAGGMDYAKIIGAVFSDERVYLELRQKARKAYEERLNWRSWALSFGQAVQEVLGIKPARIGCKAEIAT